MFVFRYSVSRLWLACYSFFIFAQITYGGPRVAKLPFALKKPKAPVGVQTAILVDVTDKKPKESAARKKTIQAAIHEPLVSGPHVDWDHDVVGIADFDCPNGFDLLENRCIQMQYRDPVLSCPYGAFRNKFGQCIQLDSVPPERVCPAGFEYYMQGCIRRSTRIPTISCAMGFVDMGSICVQPSAIPPTRVCPPGFVDESTDTGGGMCLQKTLLAARLRCHEGETLMEDGRCLRLDNTLGETICPDHYALVQETEVDLAECARKAEYVGSVTCPLGYEVVILSAPDNRNHIPRCQIIENPMDLSQAAPPGQRTRDFEPRKSIVYNLFRRQNLNNQTTHTLARGRARRLVGYVAIQEIVDASINFDRASCNSQDLELIDWTDPLKPVCTEIHTVDALVVCNKSATIRLVCSSDDADEEVGAIQESSDVIEQAPAPQELTNDDQVPAPQELTNDDQVPAPQELTNEDQVDDSAHPDTDPPDQRGVEGIKILGRRMQNSESPGESKSVDSNTEWWDGLFQEDQLLQIQESVRCQRDNRVPLCQTEYYSLPEKWCPDGSRLVISSNGKSQDVCERIERVPPSLVCPLGIGDISKSGLCQALLTAPQSVSCSEGYDDRSQSGPKKVAKVEPSICQRVEYADYQTVCPAGYERDGPKNNAKACVADKIVAPSWICEPGFWPTEDGTNRCKKTVVVAPALVPINAHLEPDSSPSTVCMVTDMAALACGAERRYFATPTRQGYRQGTTNRERLQKKQSDHLKKY